MWNFAKVWTFAKSYNTDSIHSPHKRYLGARNSYDLCKDNGIECHNGQGVTINTIEINYWTGYDVTVYKFGDISSSEWNWKYVTRDNGDKSKFSREPNCTFCNWTSEQLYQGSINKQLFIHIIWISTDTFY